MIRGIQNVFSQSQTLEQFVSDVLQWPLNDMKNFANQWKYRDVSKILSKHRSQIESVLDTIKPDKHSLAYSYILGFKATEKLEGDQAHIFISQFQALVHKADHHQISIAPRAFADALRTFVDFMRQINPIQLIHLLKKCVQILQGDNKTVLTYAHSELVYCCVQSYCYHLAFPEISQDIVEVQELGAIQAMDNLQYHYYVGLVYIGVKNLTKALEAFTMVLTAPTDSISIIQIEAYKKYILCSLIQKRQLINLPRYTPKILTRYFPKLCSEYLELADNFNRGSEAVSKLISQHYDIYQKDHNFGLVKQVLKSLEKHAVIKLTSIYTRLSLQKVVELCKFDSIATAKRVLISMIQNQELSATIDAEDVVTFQETVTQSDVKMLKNMQERIQSLLELWGNLDKAQIEIKKSPQYIKKILNSNNNNNNLEADIQQQMLIESMMNGANFFRG